jgi:hypothetical protein
MVKAGEAENCYTARSGRPAAWLKQDGDSAPYSFSTVMEVRALMGPDARKEEARRMEEAKVGRRKRALTREAVGSGLKEAIREMGLMEDIVRAEACEKGIVKGGGIRKKDKADVAIFRGIKLDAVPAWAEYGRGRGGRGSRGGQGLRGALGGSGARGGQGLRGARGGGRGGYDSRGGARGGQGLQGARGRGRGGESSGRGGGGGSQTLSGANVSVIAEAPDRKRKLTEDDEDTEEAKKVKLMEMASPSSCSSSAVASASSSLSSSASGQAKKEGGKSLLGILMSGKRVDVGKGFRLFD